MTKKYKVLWEGNHGPQTGFLASPAREILYGGQVAAGKTDALIHLPLYRVWDPKHQGIILRRESKYLRELIDRMKLRFGQLPPQFQPRWYESKDKHYFLWPSGAKTWMGYAEDELDIEKYGSFEFDLIEWEELTEFEESQYMFMFLRNRSKSKDLPPIIRGATNPGGEGMNWVYDRFINPDNGHTPFVIEDHWVEHEYLKEKVNVTRQFIPAGILDNPKIPNRDQYIAGIAQEKGDMADAYLLGIWGRFRGQYFTRDPLEVEAKIADQGNWFVIRALDYGYTDQTCIIYLVVCPKMGLVDIAGEIYGKRMTTDVIAAKAKVFEKENGWVGKVFYSPAGKDTQKGGTDGGQSVRTMLQQKGYWCTMANDDRVSGWARIALLISRGQLRAWKGRAPNLKRTLTKLVRDPRKPNDVKGRQEDHPGEALRYGVMEFYDNLEEALTVGEGGQVQRRRDGEGRDPGVDMEGNLLIRPARGEDCGLPGWS